MTYNIEIAKMELLNYGYYLDTDEYINNHTKMPCHDNDGFKYLISMNDYRINRHPYKFIKSNPYTIENIQMILDKETDGVVILENEYINQKTKMKFKCSCGDIFYMDLSSFTSGKRYCNHCAKSKRYDGLVDYTSIIEKECIKRNYTLLTKNITRSNQEFEYICNYHNDKGIQKSYYDRFINMQQGCKYCGVVSRGNKHRIDINDAIKLTEEKGFIFVGYEYIKTNDNSSSKLKLKCVCKIHKDKGVQLIDYQNLKKNKIGCIYCKGLGRTKESFQKELNDNKRDIDIIGFDSYSNIKAKCNKCGYIWNTSGVNLTSGHGCPKCNKSKYEKIVENILIDNHICYIPQFKFDDCRDINPLPFDFYITEYKTLIEVDGQGHYYPVNFMGMSNEDAIKSFENTIIHDSIKNEYCKNHNYNLLRIPYYFFDDKQIDIEQYILRNI